MSGYQVPWYEAKALERPLSVDVSKIVMCGVEKEDRAAGPGSISHAVRHALKAW